MAKKTKDFDFSKRAARYDDGIEGKASRKFYNLLLREAELQSGAKVLDAGCGTGALLKKFADKSDIIGYGIDTEEKMIAEAKSKCPGMVFAAASCDNMPFEDQSLDVVIACMAYHHFRNKEGFAREAARVLKTGGVLYIADPRFPWLMRKALNGFFRLIRVEGAFYKPKEIESQFAKFGFSVIGTATDFYAQLIKLQRHNRVE